MWFNERPLMIASLFMKREIDSVERDARHMHVFADNTQRVAVVRFTTVSSCFLKLRMTTARFCHCCKEPITAVWKYLQCKLKPILDSLYVRHICDIV